MLAGSDPRTALAEAGVMDGLKKALAERVLSAEMDHDLEVGKPEGRPKAIARRRRQRRGGARFDPCGCDAGRKVVGRKHDAEAGRAVLNAFADGPRGRTYPRIVAASQRHWPEVIPFFALPDEMRRIATVQRTCCAKPGAGSRSSRA